MYVNSFLVHQLLDFKDNECMIILGGDYKIQIYNNKSYYQNLLMNPANMQSHVIRVKVAIKRVAMTIKFPCSLAFQLRSENRVYDGGRLYELRNNECNVNDAIEGDFECAFAPNKQRYEDKKVQLLVSIVSATGKVSAGKVSLSLFMKEMGNSCDIIQLLEKCPDRQAKIYLSYYCQFLRTGMKLDKTYINELKSIASGANLNLQMTSARIGKTPILTQRTEGPKHVKGNKSLANDDLMMFSYVEEVMETGAKKKVRPPIKELQTFNPYKGTGISPQYNEPHSIDHRKDKPKPYPQTQPRQKFKFTPTPPRIDKEEQILINKLKDSPLSDQENERWIEKIKKLQKRQRQFNSSLKQVKEDLQRKKAKISVLENQKDQHQIIIRQKDSKIRYLQKQLKNLHQKVEDTASELKTTKFHLQLKESSNRQQIKKIQERYKIAQSQRERLNSECERVLHELQDLERKYANSMKQKQKQFSEQRIKLNKKIEHMSQQIQRVTNQLSEFHGEAAELAQQNRLLSKTQSEAQMLLISHESNSQMMQSSLRKQIEYRKLLQREIEQLKQNEHQRSILKKKNGELALQFASLTQKINRTEKLNQELQNALRMKDQQIQKRNQQKVQLNNKYFQLKKSYESIKCEQQVKLKEIQSLTLQNTNMNTKLQEIKQKLQSEKKMRQQMAEDFEERWSHAQQIKNQYETELQELRWRIDRNENNLHQLQKQHEKIIDQNYKLGEDLFQKQEKIKKTEENLRGMHGSIQNNETTLIECQTKKKEISIQLKQSKQQLQQSRRKNQKLEEDFHHLKERAKAAQAAFKQKILQEQKKIKELESQMHVKLEAILNFEVELLTKSQLLSENRSIILQKESQITHLRQIHISMRRQFESIEQAQNKHRQAENDYRQRLQESEKQCQKWRNEALSLSVLLQKSQQNFKDYKTQCYRSFEILHAQLTRQEQSLILPINSVPIPSFSSQSELNTRIEFFPDARISRLQMEIIVRRNQNLARWRSKQLQHSEEKQYLQSELEKMKKKIIQSEMIRESQLSKQKQKSRLILLEMQSERDAQYRQISKLEQELEKKSKAIDQLNYQFVRLKDQYDDQSLELRTLFEEHKKCSIIISQIELQQSNDHTKSHANPIQIEIHNQGEQINKIKESLSAMQKKVIQKQRQCADRIQQMRLISIECNTLAYEKNRMDQIVVEFQQKINSCEAEIGRHQKMIKQKQKEIKRQADALVGQIEIKNTLQSKFDELQQKMRGKQMQIMELQDNILRYKEEIETLERKRMEDAEEENKRREAHRIDKEKCMETIKSLKDKHLLSTSEYDLCAFMNKQLQQQIKVLQMQLQSAKEQVSQRKRQIISLKEACQQQRRRQAMFEERMNGEKKEMDAILQKNKKEIISLRHALKDCSQLESEVYNKQKEIQRLQRLSESGSAVKIMSFSKSQSQQNTHKKQNSSNENDQYRRKQEQFRRKQDQYKRKIKQLQKLLAEQNYEVNAFDDRKRLLHNFDREKQELESQIEQLTDKIESSKAKWNQELAEKQNAIEELEEELATKDFIINNQQLQIDRMKAGISLEEVEEFVIKDRS